MEPDGKTGKVLTVGLGMNFYDEMNDTPGPAHGCGMGGWIEVKESRGQSSELAVVYDFYDLSLLDPSGVAPPRRPTTGREPKQTFRVQDLSGDYAEGGGRLSGGRRQGGYLIAQPELLPTMTN